MGVSAALLASASRVGAVAVESRFTGVADARSAAGVIASSVAAGLGVAAIFSPVLRSMPRFLASVLRKTLMVVCSALPGVAVSLSKGVCEQTGHSVVDRDSWPRFSQYAGRWA